MIAVYSGNHMTLINKMCVRKMQSYYMLNQVVHIVTTVV
jgi:hypothetical protein